MALLSEQGSHIADSIHNPFYSKALKPPIDATWQARRDLADTLRELIESTVCGNHDLDTIEALNKVLRDQTQILKANQQYEGRHGFHTAEPERYPTIAGNYYELSPFIGRSNPLSVPMVLWISGDEIHGEVNPGWQYEGPPSSLHGGFIAALFDEFLGLGQRITGRSGFTGTLSVRYINLTPLNTDLRLIGRVKLIEARKKTLMAEMWAGDVLTATCEGLFIDVPAPVVQSNNK